MLLLEIVFWGSAFCLVFAYGGYPILMGLLAYVRPRPNLKHSFMPKVSLIICAYNEEDEIQGKLENTLALDYQSDQLQILVVSDNSTDGTNEIVKRYSAKGVELIVLPERQGKTVAQDIGVSHAKGEILVFSDASIMLPPESLKNLVRNFGDATVGCVSCEDKSVKIEEGKKIADEGIYVRYEMLVRKWESTFGSIVGASGCFYAVRKKLWRKPEQFLVVDFTTPLDVFEQGFRTVSDPDAHAFVRTSSSFKEEFSRRVRTATRGQIGLLCKRNLLNPLRYGFFSFQLISHKLLRFLGPFCLGLLFVCNVALISEGSLYQGFMGLQVVFYAFVFVGWTLRFRQHKLWFFSFPFYFVLVNWAIFVAWIRVYRGNTDAMWAPTQRVSA